MASISTVLSIFKSLQSKKEQKTYSMLAQGLVACYLKKLFADMNSYGFYNAYAVSRNVLSVFISMLVS